MPVYIEATIEGEQQLSRRLMIVADGVEDWREPLGNIKEELLKTIDLNFTMRGGLFGGWQPAKKDYGHPLLEDTGRMRDGFEGEVGSDLMKISNPVPYFRYHQSNKARRKLPRRVMMKIDQERRTYIIKQFQAYIVALTRGKR